MTERSISIRFEESGLGAILSQIRSGGQEIERSTDRVSDAISKVGQRFVKSQSNIVRAFQKTVRDLNVKPVTVEVRANTGRAQRSLEGLSQKIDGASNRLDTFSKNVNTAVDEISSDFRKLARVFQTSIRGINQPIEIRVSQRSVETIQALIGEVDAGRKAIRKPLRIRLDLSQVQRARRELQAIEKQLSKIGRVSLQFSAQAGDPTGGLAKGASRELDAFGKAAADVPKKALASFRSSINQAQTLADNFGRRIGSGIQYVLDTPKRIVDSLRSSLLQGRKLISNFADRTKSEIASLLDPVATIKRIGQAIGKLPASHRFEIEHNLPEVYAWLQKTKDGVAGISGGKIDVNPKEQLSFRRGGGSNSPDFGFLGQIIVNQTEKIIRAIRALPGRGGGGGGGGGSGGGVAFGLAKFIGGFILNSLLVPYKIALGALVAAFNGVFTGVSNALAPILVFAGGFWLVTHQAAFERITIALESLVEILNSTIDKFATALDISANLAEATNKAFKSASRSFQKISVATSHFASAFGRTAESDRLALDLYNLFDFADDRIAELSGQLRDAGKAFPDPQRESLNRFLNKLDAVELAPEAGVAAENLLRAGDTASDLLVSASELSSELSGALEGGFASQGSIDSIREIAAQLHEFASRSQESIELGREIRDAVDKYGVEIASKMFGEEATGEKSQTAPFGAILKGLLIKIFLGTVGAAIAKFILDTGVPQKKFGELLEGSLKELKPLLEKLSKALQKLIPDLGRRRGDSEPPEQAAGGSTPPGGGDSGSGGDSEPPQDLETRLLDRFGRALNRVRAPIRPPTGQSLRERYRQSLRETARSAGSDRDDFLARINRRISAETPRDRLASLKELSKSINEMRKSYLKAIKDGNLSEAKRIGQNLVDGAARIAKVLTAQREQVAVEKQGKSPRELEQSGLNTLESFFRGKIPWIESIPEEVVSGIPVEKDRRNRARQGLADLIGDRFGDLEVRQAASRGEGISAVADRAATATPPPESSREERGVVNYFVETANTAQTLGDRFRELRETLATIPPQLEAVKTDLADIAELARVTAGAIGVLGKGLAWLSKKFIAVSLASYRAGQTTRVAFDGLLEKFAPIGDKLLEIRKGFGIFARTGQRALSSLTAPLDGLLARAKAVARSILREALAAGKGLARVGQATVSAIARLGRQGATAIAKLLASLPPLGRRVGQRLAAAFTDSGQQAGQVWRQAIALISRLFAGLAADGSVAGDRLSTSFAETATQLRQSLKQAIAAAAKQFGALSKAGASVGDRLLESLSNARAGARQPIAAIAKQLGALPKGLKRSFERTIEQIQKAIAGLNPFAKRGAAEPSEKVKELYRQTASRAGVDPETLPELGLMRDPKALGRHVPSRNRIDIDERLAKRVDRGKIDEKLIRVLLDEIRHSQQASLEKLVKVKDLKSTLSREQLDRIRAQALASTDLAEQRGQISRKDRAKQFQFEFDAAQFNSLNAKAIADEMRSPSRAAIAIGRFFGQGIAIGLTGYDLAKPGRAAATELIEAFNRRLGISSPSKEGKKAGRFFGLGADAGLRAFDLAASGVDAAQRLMGGFRRQSQTEQKRSQGLFRTIEDEVLRLRGLGQRISKSLSISPATIKGWADHRQAVQTTRDLINRFSNSQSFTPRQTIESLGLGETASKAANAFYNRLGERQRAFIDRTRERYQQAQEEYQRRARASAEDTRRLAEEGRTTRDFEQIAGRVNVQTGEREGGDLQRERERINRVQREGSAIARAFKTATAPIRSILNQNPVASRLFRGLSQLGIAFLSYAGISQFSDAIATFARASFEAALNADRLKVSIGSLVGSKEATKTLERLKDAADEAGSSFIAAAEGFSTLSAAAFGSSLQGQEEGIIGAFQKMFLLSGTAEEAQGRVFTQLGQAISRGFIETEEFRILLEAIPGFGLSLQNALGKTMAELFDMASRRALRTVEILPKLRDQFNLESASGIGIALDSFSAKLQQFSNAVEATKIAFGEMFFKPLGAALPLLTRLLGVVEQNTGAFAKFAQVIGFFVVGTFAKGIANSVIALLKLRSLKELVKVLISLSKFGIGPFTKIFGLIPLMFGQIGRFIPILSGIRKTVLGFIGKVSVGLAGVTQALFTTGRQTVTLGHVFRTSFAAMRLEVGTTGFRIATLREGFRVMSIAVGNYTSVIIGHILRIGAVLTKIIAQFLPALALTFAIDGIFGVVRLGAGEIKDASESIAESAQKIEQYYRGAADASKEIAKNTDISTGNFVLDSIDFSFAAITDIPSYFVGFGKILDLFSLNAFKLSNKLENASDGFFRPALRSQVNRREVQIENAIAASEAARKALDENFSRIGVDVQKQAQRYRDELQKIRAEISALNADRAAQTAIANLDDLALIDKQIKALQKRESALRESLNVNALEQQLGLFESIREQLLTQRPLWEAVGKEADWSEALKNTEAQIEELTVDIDRLSEVLEDANKAARALRFNFSQIRERLEFDDYGQDLEDAIARRDLIRQQVAGDLTELERQDRELEIQSQRVERDLLDLQNAISLQIKLIAEGFSGTTRAIASQLATGQFDRDFDLTSLLEDDAAFFRLRSIANAEDSTVSDEIKTLVEEVERVRKLRLDLVQKEIELSELDLDLAEKLDRLLDRRLEKLSAGLRALDEQIDRDRLRQETDLLNRGAFSGRQADLIQSEIGEIEARDIRRRVDRLKAAIAKLEDEFRSDPEFGQGAIAVRAQLDARGLPATGASFADIEGDESLPISTRQAARILAARDELHQELVQAERDAAQSLLDRRDRYRDSLRTVRDRVRDFNRTIEDYFRDLQKQIAETQIEIERSLREIAYSEIRLRLRRLLRPWTNSFFDSLIEPVLGLLDEAQGLGDRRFDLRSQRLQFQNELFESARGLEDFGRQIRDATRELAEATGILRILERAVGPQSARRQREALEIDQAALQQGDIAASQQSSVPESQKARRPASQAAIRVPSPPAPPTEPKFPDREPTDFERGQFGSLAQPGAIIQIEGVVDFDSVNLDPEFRAELDAYRAAARTYPQELDAYRRELDAYNQRWQGAAPGSLIEVGVFLQDGDVAVPPDAIAPLDIPDFAAIAGDNEIARQAVAPNQEIARQRQTEMAIGQRQFELSQEEFADEVEVRRKTFETGLREQFRQLERELLEAGDRLADLGAEYSPQTAIAESARALREVNRTFLSQSAESEQAVKRLNVIVEQMTQAVSTLRVEAGELRSLGGEENLATADALEGTARLTEERIGQALRALEKYREFADRLPELERKATAEQERRNQLNERQARLQLTQQRLQSQQSVVELEGTPDRRLEISRALEIVGSQLAVNELRQNDELRARPKLLVELIAAEKERSRLQLERLDLEHQISRLEQEESYRAIERETANARAAELERQGFAFRAAAMQQEAAMEEESNRYAIEQLQIRRDFAGQEEEIQRRLTAAAARNQANIKAIDKQYKSFGETLVEAGQQATESFFGELITGAKSVGEAFRELALSVLRSVGQMFAKRITAGIFSIFSGGGEVGNFRDGGMPGLDDIPNYSQGNGIDSKSRVVRGKLGATLGQLPGVMRAKRLEGAGAKLAVFNLGERILGARNGESARYNVLERMFGSLPLQGVFDWMEENAEYFRDGGVVGGYEQKILASLPQISAPKVQIEPVLRDVGRQQQPAQRINNITVNIGGGERDDRSRFIGRRDAEELADMLRRMGVG